MITGQIIIRETESTVDGRELVMFFGIMAAEKGAKIDLKGEHQYILVGEEINPGVIELQIAKSTEIARTDEIRGDTPSGILTMPIWRV